MSGKYSQSAYSFFVLAVIVLLPLRVFAQGEDNPTGVSGIYNGNVTTGCSYDPQTFNALRGPIDDIVVPGSVGAYPLKWTRYNNSRSNHGAWSFSYEYGMGPPGDTIKFPDGRTINFNAEEVPVTGVEERKGSWNGHPAILLADGGKVLFDQHFYSGSGVDITGHPYTIYYTATIPIQIIDPYGHVTTITYENPMNDEYGNPTWRRVRITEPAPGGRYLQLNYGSNPANTIAPRNLTRKRRLGSTVCWSARTRAIGRR